jgi:hypothetical protein
MAVNMSTIMVNQEEQAAAFAALLRISIIGRNTTLYLTRECDNDVLFNNLCPPSSRGFHGADIRPLTLVWRRGITILGYNFLLRVLIISL